MTAAEIAQKLSELTNTYGGSNPLPYQQYRNANAGLDWLNENKNSFDNPSDYDSYAAQMKADKANAGISGALSVLNGLTSIAGTTMQNAQIGDTSQYERQIKELGLLGNGNYTSFDQLSSDYGRIDSIRPDLDYDTIRGGSDTQRAGNVLTSTISGASAGLSVGGPWGALAGAVVGLGSGIGGWIAGNTDARDKERSLRFDAKVASDDAVRNLNFAAENLTEYKFRSGVSNRADMGGRIDRYMSKAKKTARRAPDVPLVNMVRMKKKGGTVIRLK